MSLSDLNQLEPVQFLKVLERIAQLKGTEQKVKATSEDMVRFIR